MTVIATSSESRIRPSEGKKANRLQATKLNNKMVNEYWQDLFRAPEEGRLVCWYEGIQMNPFLEAADIAWVHGEAAAALLAARKQEGPSQKKAEEAGFDRELCSYARTHAGCAVMRTESGTPESMGGAKPENPGLAEQIPAPDMIISAYPFCSTGQQWDEAIYRIYGKKVPIFNISMPWIWGNKSSSGYMSGPEFRESVDFMVKQLRECIKFIEEQTGKPYDYDRLSEIMGYTKKAAQLRMEAKALCKVTPSPASFFEWTNSIAPVNFLPGGQPIVDYFVEMKREIQERIDNGIGSVPDEKYRLFWDGIMNWNKIGYLSDKFANYDSCVVSGRYTHLGFWQDYQVIDVNDPIEGMAMNFLTCPISVSAPQMIERIIEHCEEYRIDGILLHGARTCRAFSYPQYLIADAVGKRMGMPVAMFEGDMVDESFYKDELINSRVEAMLEQIEARRGRNL